MEKYTTYENKPNKRVCIHKLPCNDMADLGKGYIKIFTHLKKQKFMQNP